MHFDYEGDPKVALKNIKKILENEGFKIIEYAPEDGFLFTDYKEFNWGTGRRIIAVTAHVHDKIIITGMGSMDIPVRFAPNRIGQNQVLPERHSGSNAG